MKRATMPTTIAAAVQAIKAQVRLHAACLGAAPREAAPVREAPSKRAQEYPQSPKQEAHDQADDCTRDRCNEGVGKENP